MDVQITIKISKEALGEAVEVFRKFLSEYGSVEGVSVSNTTPATPVAPPAPTPAPQATNPMPTPEQMAAPAPAPQTTVPAPAPAPVPTTERTYSADELQVAAVSLVDKGMMAQLQGLLQQFGVQSLPELTPDKYGAFATALRGMGASI